MTFFSIPRISNQGEQISLSLSISSGASSCRKGALRGFGQHPVQPIACQYDIGARQLCAFAAALRAPCSILDEAVRLQISLFRQANPVFFSCTYNAYAKHHLKSYWHTTSVTLGKHPLPLYGAGIATPVLRVEE